MTPRSLLFLLAALAAVSLSLGGCVTPTNYATTKHLGDGDGGRTILLMPVDIELSELAASGATTLKADWTETAKRLATDALREFLRKRKATLKVRYVEEEFTDPDSTEVQLVKLNEAVGRAILHHQVVQPYQLPSKNGAFDWTLGPDVAVLRHRSDANYGLFITIRDSYATGGRAAAIFLAATLFGTALPGGQQFGYASLVDLTSGDVVWFNLLVRGAGDLRQPAPARETIELLLAGFPE